MDYIQINPDNVAPSAPRPRIRKAAAYLLYRQLISGGGGIVTDDLVLRSNFNDMANLSLTFPSNGSAEFNGTSDYVQILANGKGSAFDTQEFTIGAWVYPNSLTNDFIIWSYDFTSQTPPYYAQHLRISSGVNKLFFGFNQSGAFEGLDGGNALSLNQWYYVTATYKSGEQKIYVDGSQVGSESNVGTITYYNQEVWIGRSNYAYANGNLANVAIWNRVLSSDEINSVMWKQYEEISTSERNGLQAWYALDSVDTFADWYTYAQNQGAVIEGRTCVDNALNALAQL
jgi:hypothetical protein